MGEFQDLTGMRFGRLTVLSRAEDYISPKGYRNAQWLCRCDCGRELTVRGCNIRNGKSLSCGCNRVIHPNRTRHGKSNTRIHKIWKGIKQRCENPSNSSYEDYGGRGIEVCDEWSEFESFCEWSMKNGYGPDKSIDRVDNSLGYSPGNCRWADGKAQANNTRHNHMLTYKGETKTMMQWSEETGIKYQKIKDRINKCGWTVEKTLTTK